MQIFNKLLGKSDFEAFLDLTREAKVSWIKKYTNQQNETLINEFLDSPFKDDKGCCIGCGTLNNKFVKNESFSKANAIEVADSSAEVVVAEPSSTDSAKRPKKSKRGKN